MFMELFDPNGDGCTLLRSRAMCGEYLPEANSPSDVCGSGTRLSRKDLEKIREDLAGTSQEPLTERQEALRDAIADAIRASLYDLVTTFSEYFTDDFENELTAIVRAYELFGVVARDVKERNAIATPSESWPKERQEAYRARMAYLFAKRRIEGVKDGLQTAEDHLSRMASYICEKHGNCLGTDF